MKAKFITMLFIYILFITWQMCNAETINVDLNGGGDYLTIQEGINAAIDADTVLVYPGTYYENIDDFTIKTLEI